MLKKDDKVFFRLPKEDSQQKRVLRPGTVLEMDNDMCVIQLEGPCTGATESTNAFLHFEQRKKFLQQSVCVVRIDSEEPMVLAVQLRGEPVSAESRQCFRVSCLSANIKATIGDDADCEVVDVSATGFAFYSSREYEIGRQFKAKLHHDGKEYAGQVTIQSARRSTPKVMRYGVHGGADATSALAKSLASINLAVQGQQLRRLSGRT